MALINCPECGKQISEQATSCPHCGFPLKRSNKKEIDKLDFDSMEVILHRGVKGSFIFSNLVLPWIIIDILVALTIVFFVIGTDYWGAAIFLSIVSGAEILALVPLTIITAVKLKNNSVIEKQNLYYDEKANKFYAIIGSDSVLTIDGVEVFRAGNNFRGFGETVIVYQGQRYYIGYSLDNLNVANQKILQIRQKSK